MNTDLAKAKTDADIPQDPADTAKTTAPSGIPWRPRITPIDVASLMAVVATLSWAYWPNLLSLYRTWSREPDYSHGFLVLPIALVILWKRWPKTGEVQATTWFPGLVLVTGALGMRAFFHERGQTWSESMTLLVVIFGLGLTRLGWPMMRRVWAAFAFLIFLFPLPNQVNAALSQPLQSLATTCACALLKLTGLWVMPEGNVILVGNERLEVAAACNGLSMLMSLAATVAAFASLMPMATGKRVVLLAFIIPIALLSNVLRITATAWCYYEFGTEVGSKYAHDAAGWLMMPTAMVLVFLLLQIMNWVIIEAEVTEQTGDRLGLGMTTAGGLRPLEGRS